MDDLIYHLRRPTYRVKNASPCAQTSRHLLLPETTHRHINKQFEAMPLDLFFFNKTQISQNKITTRPTSEAPGTILLI